MASLAELQNRLGYTFHEESRLRLALTHPSVAHDANAPVPHNQRLEFLGDSVLSVVLSHELFAKFPGADEGQLTKTRAKLVNATSLATHARLLGLGTYLILSPGEERTGGRERTSTLADAYEALLGAIYVDGGLPAAQAFINREFAAEMSQLAAPAGIENPKGELQEWLQADSSSAPVYELVSAEGPDHDRNFICAVFHRGTELGRGAGKSKRAAESDAALNALRKLRP